GCERSKPSRNCAPSSSHSPGAIMKLGSPRGMDTKRPRGSERSKPCHESQLTRRSQPPYPWPHEQAQPGVSKPCRTTDLPPQDAKNRFQMVFRRFLGVFAREEHPLALFLDDLQWLDAATLELLEHLVTHPDVRRLLLVGAYRDNEVGPAHPLMRTLEAIRNAGARVEEIVLSSRPRRYWP